MRIKGVSTNYVRQMVTGTRLAKPFGIAFIVGVAGVLTACQTTMPDSRLVSSTSGVLGIPPEDLTISNRHSESNGTYYIATTRTGRKYACVVTGGGVLALGLSNPPRCNSVAQR